MPGVDDKFGLGLVVREVRGPIWDDAVRLRVASVGSDNGVDFDGGGEVEVWNSFYERVVRREFGKAGGDADAIDISLEELRAALGEDIDEVEGDVGGEFDELREEVHGFPVSQGGATMWCGHEHDAFGRFERTEV